ncbi:hypothetical protein B296_00044371 [Ensete ventricosum]|uniref:TPR1-like CTLH-containing domain-containing protein n=1 Tax=Ensete ventricosum TaxID=4639 RepID=A0A426ZB62_ENSVE|nr:hypothetical protein B296_00044371 [Ensete ventricosum]
MWGRKGRCLVLKVRMTVLPLRSGGERLGVEIPEKPLIRPYYCRQSDMAFGRHDRAKAVQILVKDLKLFASFNEELFKEITVLLTLENFSFSLTNTNQPKFIFSTAIDGKIKAWLYDCLGSRVDYDAPGRWCTTMAYSADGTSKDGDSHLVEWNETEGTIKRTYSGFRKRSLGVVQFDTTRNRFLAAGDEFMIKFWDMDNANILTTSDADGGLPVITTSDNGIKILANADGQRLVRMLESRAFDGSRGSFQLTNANVKAPVVGALGAVSNVSSPVAATPERPDRVLPAVSMMSLAVMDSNRAADVKPRISEDTEKIKSWKLADVVDSAHIKALHLPDSTSTKSKVFRVLAKNLTRQFLIWLHETFLSYRCFR